MDEDMEQLDWGDVGDDHPQGDDAVMRDDDAISLGGADDDLEELQKYQAAKGVEADSPTAANGSGDKPRAQAAVVAAPSALPQQTEHKDRRSQKPTEHADSRHESTRQRASGPRPSSPPPRQSSSGTSSRPRRPPLKQMATPIGPLALPPKPPITASEPFLPPSHPSLTEASSMTVRGRERNGSGGSARTHAEMLRGLSADWVIHTSSQGADYYYNTRTLETQWERPDFDTGKTRDSRSSSSVYPEPPPPDYARADSRRYPDEHPTPPPPPPPPRGEDSASSWQAGSSGGRRDDRDLRRGSHYSPEQTRVPLAAPRGRSPPPPPVQPVRRSISPPRGINSWRPAPPPPINNDRSWRPTAEDERRWEQRERERERERERSSAQEPNVKERRPRGRSADNTSRRTNGSANTKKDDVTAPSTFTAPIATTTTTLVRRARCKIGRARTLLLPPRSRLSSRRSARTLMLDVFAPLCFYPLSSRTCAPFSFPRPVL
ncbi:hypothetical protein EXIGLDRAFT_212161 [Exidia glandulosa HHB12029]|uniref:WW domain-containing protein n=1 Tax=Exidia glandulosa HHB12029 TaxID=1314781 RepID=A0A165EIC6_EXIGL|nr:hypothetical protein EXIGLDRAFT_212161 [Exidia glandulosa HHB12029]